MKERSIALASLLGGLFVFGLVASIQLDRFVLTRAAPLAPEQLGPANATLGRVESAPQPGAPVASEAGVPVLQLPPIHITASPRAAQSKATEASVSPGPVEPCSEWREVGFPVVVDGKPNGVRRVRDLC